MLVKVTWAEPAAHGASLSPALRDELDVLRRTERTETSSWRQFSDERGGYPHRRRFQSDEAHEAAAAEWDEEWPKHRNVLHDVWDRRKSAIERALPLTVDEEPVDRLELLAHEPEPARQATYVVSSTLEQVDWNAELVRGDLGEAVQQLKRESGKGLFVGGVKLPLALTELGLIDEYEFVVHPRLAGHGPTLFAGLSTHVDLKLVSRLEFDSGQWQSVRAEKVAVGFARPSGPQMEALFGPRAPHRKVSLRGCPRQSQGLAHLGALGDHSRSAGRYP